jgi:hypothetical protein
VTAVSSTVVRHGRQSVYTADERYVETREPDIWAHLYRDGLHVEWEITAGPYGEALAWGRTWTKGGARWKAFAAAQRPGILGGAR